ncbi:MAG: ABC transporter permease [bacterium]|nr:ABC transporter permease [bacterium]
MNNKEKSYYIIKAKRGLAAFDLHELFYYRDLLLFIALRNIKVRYKQTAIGATWAIIQPFLTMVVFSIFFGTLAKIPSDSVPYPIFVYSGLLPWTFFSNVIRFSGTSIIEDERLITKVYFPRIIIPSSVVGVELLDFCISFIILIAMLFYYKISLTLGILLLPLLVIIMIGSALGVGLILSALTVAYRDFRYVVTFLVQLWMFVSPVLYPVTIVPKTWRWLLAFNPMTGVIEGFRSAILNKPFDTPILLISFLSAVILFFVGLLYFRYKERSFADII